MLVQDNPHFHLSTSYSTTINKQKKKKNRLKTYAIDCCGVVHCHLTERMLLLALRKRT